MGPQRRRERPTATSRALRAPDRHIEERPQHEITEKRAGPERTPERIQPTSRGRGLRADRPLGVVAPRPGHSCRTPWAYRPHAVGVRAARPGRTSLTPWAYTPRAEGVLRPLDDASQPALLLRFDEQRDQLGPRSRTAPGSCAGSRPSPGRWTSASCRCRRNRRHTAAYQTELRTVHYRFHPRAGGQVEVLRRRDPNYLVVRQPDGTRACLPEWMTRPEASGFEVREVPALPREALSRLARAHRCILPLGGGTERGRQH